MPQEHKNGGFPDNFKMFISKVTIYFIHIVHYILLNTIHSSLLSLMILPVAGFIPRFTGQIYPKTLKNTFVYSRKQNRGMCLTAHQLGQLI